MVIAKWVLGVFILIIGLGIVLGKRVKHVKGMEDYFDDEDMELVIRHSPPECADNCEEENCPYTHRHSWEIWEAEHNLYIAGPFESEAEARAARNRFSFGEIAERIKQDRLNRLNPIGAARESPDADTL